MEITTEQVKELRDKTGISVMKCREALIEAAGDLAKAEEILHKSAALSAAKKADRELAAGTIGTYVHDGSVGAMVLLACETDFVSKNPEFSALAKDLAMQVSAMAPESSEALLEGAFIKDGGKKVKDLLAEATQKFGERIEIAQFARMSAR